MWVREEDDEEDAEDEDFDDSMFDRLAELRRIFARSNAIRKHKCFLCSPFYGRACRWAMLGELKPKGPKGSIIKII